MGEAKRRREYRHKSGHDCPLCNAKSIVLHGLHHNLVNSGDAPICYPSDHGDDERDAAVIVDFGVLTVAQRLNPHEIIVIAFGDTVLRWKQGEDESEEEFTCAPGPHIDLLSAIRVALDRKYGPVAETKDGEYRTLISGHEHGPN